MSRRRRQTYSGCSVEARSGTLRLRFRPRLPDGSQPHVSRQTGLADTEENRAACRTLADLIGAAVANRLTLAQVDEILLKAQGKPLPPVPPLAPASIENVITVASYFEGWIAEREVMVRKAHAIDLRRHIANYVLPVLGPLPLAQLRTADLRGLQ